MADPMQAIADLVKAVPQLAQVPACGLPAYGAIAAAGCGPDLACICANDNFFFALQGVIAQGIPQGTCTPVTAQESLSVTRSICTKAVPWLADDRGPEVLAAAAILTTLATIAVILRLFARKMSNLKFGADDWMIFVALVWSWGFSITQFYALHYGLGRHFLMLETDQLESFAKSYFASTMTFPVSVILIKLSVLNFYQRIFPMQRFRNISIAIAIVSIIWFIIYVFLIFFLCVPLAFWWDKTIPGGHCIDAKVSAYYGTSPLDILTNIAILILPLPYLWRLQMHRAKKIAISFIFLLGGFATVGSIVRIPLIHQLKNTDPTWTIVNCGIWLNVESNIGILSACLPVMRPLFSKTFSATLRSRLTRSHTSRGSQRLPDAEKGTPASTLASGGTKEGVYQGGGKGHKSWFDTAVSGLKSGDERMSDGGSTEEMVPMGRIAVRSEVNWDAKEEGEEGKRGRV